MSRISIDVTEEEHKRLKALAALKGVSLKEYMLSSAMDSAGESEQKTLEELEFFLRCRIDQAEKEGVSSQTVDDIFESVCIEKGVESPNG